MEASAALGGAAAAGRPASEAERKDLTAEDSRGQRSKPDGRSAGALPTHLGVLTQMMSRWQK